MYAVVCFFLTLFLVVQNNCQMCSIGVLSSLDDQPINCIDKLQDVIKKALDGKWPGWDESEEPEPLADASGVFINQTKATELQKELKFHIMHNEAALFPFFDPLLQVSCLFMFACDKSRL